MFTVFIGSFNRKKGERIAARTRGSGGRSGVGGGGNGGVIIETKSTGNFVF